jgi:hypothetical protein
MQNATFPIEAEAPNQLDKGSVPISERQSHSAKCRHTTIPILSIPSCIQIILYTILYTLLSTMMCTMLYKVFVSSPARSNVCSKSLLHVIEASRTKRGIAKAHPTYKPHGPFGAGSAPRNHTTDTPCICHLLQIFCLEWRLLSINGFFVEF